MLPRDAPIPDLVAALALHPMPVRTRMLDALLTEDRNDRAKLHRNAHLVTALCIAGVWPNEPR